MDIFAAVIVTTNISNEHANDIVKSSPLRRSTRDHSIRSQIE